MLSVVIPLAWFVTIRSSRIVVTPPFLPPRLQAARVFRLLRLLPLLRAGFLARGLLTTEGVRRACSRC